jgi:CxxC motif-containing protein (DUF1111 family)
MGKKKLDFPERFFLFFYFLTAHKNKKQKRKIQEFECLIGVVLFYDGCCCCCPAIFVVCIFVTEKKEKGKSLVNSSRPDETME